MDIRKGDGVVIHNGSRGIVTSGIFKTVSGFNVDAVRVAFKESYGTLEMPIELTWITEVWRAGARVEGARVEEARQLALW